MRTHKITLKLIKYFLYIISAAILICFIGSSIFISKFYTENEFKLLKDSSHQIHENLKQGYSYDDSSINSIIVKNNTITSLGRKKMGMINSLRDIDFESLPDKGTFKNAFNETFLYSKLSTEFGYIITFKNSKSTSQYLKIVYLILLIVFILSIVVCVPIISHVGKKFTDPIIKLQKSSQKIASGNFDFQINIQTNDEIEDLATSLKSMAINLEKKYELQKEFIANVSHDFKTPLSIMRNYSEAIKDGIVEGEDVNIYAGEIISEVDRLNILVVDLLQLSKLQSGQIPLNKEYFNIKDLLKECVDKFTFLANEKGLSLILKSDDFTIYADKSYILRVIYNFIHNAIKFSYVNTNIEIFTSKQETNVKVSVINTGNGISENMLDNIWHKYYTHQKSGGIGLGLPICSEILTLHNFKYGVSSKPNEKTEFYFIAPIKDMQ